MIKTSAVLAISLIAFAGPAHAVYRGDPNTPPGQSDQIPGKTVKLDTNTSTTQDTKTTKTQKNVKQVTRTVRGPRPPPGQPQDQGLSPAAASAIGTIIGVGVGVGLGGMGRDDDDRGMRGMH
jgi:hypothetical protein